MDASAKKDSSTRHFDRWAGEYERDRVSRWLAELQADALAALRLGPTDRLLDVGCGTGAAVRAAAATVERAVGVDLSPEMIARGRELAAALFNVDFLVADSEALPFDDASFTALLCTTSFHHYPDPERAAGEMARVLTPGGRIVLADMVRDRWVMAIVDALLRRLQPAHVRIRRAGELAALLAGTGLDVQGTRPLVHGFYAIVTASKPPSG